MRRLGLLAVAGMVVLLGALGGLVIAGSDSVIRIVKAEFLQSAEARP